MDDEAPIRELLSLFFKKKGVAVTTAVTGNEALELFSKERFDAAIVDVNLAGENGLDLLKRFKGQRPEVPVVIFTGVTSDPTLLDRSLAAGANGFMKKTEPLSQLYAELKKHLPANSEAQPLTPGAAGAEAQSARQSGV
ncbi:MAG TPA: response regulator [Verrucomicrobiae bacterium]|nr:response regulator [Verrucomicrobiae bacterium]